MMVAESKPDRSDLDHQGFILVQNLAMGLAIYLFNEVILYSGLIDCILSALKR